MATSVPTIIVTSHRNELAEMEGFNHQWRAIRDGRNSRLVTE
jgi:hypothetical protein